MPNRNYRSGRRAEYRARDMLKAQGYHTVIRAAGSKGPCDVIGLAQSGIALVQVKRGRGISQAERAELRAFKAQLPSLCTLEIWRFEAGKRTPNVEVL